MLVVIVDGSIHSGSTTGTGLGSLSRHSRVESRHGSKGRGSMARQELPSWQSLGAGPVSGGSSGKSIEISGGGTFLIVMVKVGPRGDVS